MKLEFTSKQLLLHYDLHLNCLSNRSHFKWKWNVLVIKLWTEHIVLSKLKPLFLLKLEFTYNPVWQPFYLNLKGKANGSHFLMTLEFNGYYTMIRTYKVRQTEATLFMKTKCTGYFIMIWTYIVKQTDFFFYYTKVCTYKVKQMKATCYWNWSLHQNKFITLWSAHVRLGIRKQFFNEIRAYF